MAEQSQPASSASGARDGRAGAPQSLADLGEFGLIDRIVARLGDAAARDILVPPGDDAAAWRVEAGAAVATIDALVEGNHWRRDTMAPADVGWRAVAVNVSDLAAMGASPSHLLVAVILPPDATLDEVDGLVDGMAEACRFHGIRIAGGDIIRGATAAVSIAAFGTAEVDAGGEARVLRRDAARPGDGVWVTGAPGASSAGLVMIEAGRGDEREAAPLVRAHRRPEARLAAGRAAVAAGIRCGMDVSDGLLQDLGHIAERSGVGVEVDRAALPLHAAAVALLGEAAARDLALGGGEDFELVLTGDDATLADLDEAEAPLTRIGRVVAEHPGEVVVRDERGEVYRPPRLGWDQLRAMAGPS